MVKTVSKKDIDPWVKALVFELCCNDTDGEDVEVSNSFFISFAESASSHNIMYFTQKVHQIMQCILSRKFIS